MGSSRCSLSLLSRSELSEVSVVVALHLVVEDLGLAGFSLGDKGLIENIEDILADLLKLGFNLLTVVADGADVLIRALGLFLLLNGGDDSPGSTSCANHILVCDGKEVSLVDSELSAQLGNVRSCF